jgi:transposase, IS30 family
MQTEKWNHFNQNDRDRIEILLKQGILQKDIAIVLSKSKSALSREIRRGKSEAGIYIAVVAERKARCKRLNSKYQGMKVEKNTVLQARIISEIKEGRSPDEIAGMLRLEGFDIGKDAIYKWLYSVYGDKYCKYLCTRRKRKKKHKKKTEKTLIPNRVGIEWRMEEGIHAEADTLVSGKQSRAAASMIVIQNTKLMLGNRLDSMKAEEMKNSVNNLLKNIPIDDITLDNGIENRLHEEFIKPSYFCNAHHPWEKPLVEQSIGLLRRWCIPKGTNLETITEEKYQSYLNFLNHKKRKSLGYKSAYEVSLDCGIISEIPGRISWGKVSDLVAIEGRI